MRAFHQRLPVQRLRARRRAEPPLAPTAVPIQNQPTAVPVASPTPIPVENRPTAVTVASPAAPPTAPGQGGGQVQLAGQGDLVLDQSVLEKVYKTVNPSVVNIQVIEPASLFARRRFRGGRPLRSAPVLCGTRRVTL